jgi:hypothetical protein
MSLRDNWHNFNTHICVALSAEAICRYLITNILSGANGWLTYQRK